MREVAGTEWVSLVRFGLYTGQRLGDLAGLRWSSVDLEHDEIRLTTDKRGRVVILPIHPGLKEHILSLPGSDSPDAPVHPRAARLGVNHLSREFGEVLARCGFRATASHRKAKDGRAARREVNELSFHSLRHSSVSFMKNAGASPAVVQDLVGHGSAAMSAHYTHIENDAKRQALATLPVI
jgi:integrase